MRGRKANEGSSIFIGARTYEKENAVTLFDETVFKKIFTMTCQFFAVFLEDNQRGILFEKTS